MMKPKDLKTPPAWIYPLVQAFHAWVREQERNGKIRVISIHTKNGIEERLISTETDHEDN